MPRVATIDVLVHGGASWLELEICLASGPADLYRYFPFTSYIYVEGRACSVLEFTAPHQERHAVVSVPVGKRFELRFVSELSSLPTAVDERELATMLRSIKIGNEACAPREPATVREISSYAQRAIPLIRETPEPVFVVGAYRSGTSILTWALGQHPNLWPLEETRWLQLLGSGALAGYALASSAMNHYFDTYDVSRAEYMAHVGSGIDQFMATTSKRRADEIALKRLAGLDERHDSRFQLRRTAQAPKRRWVDGTPENSDCIPLLHELFPASRFICILRDSRDVIASMLHFHRMGGSPMKAERAAAMWMQKVRNCLLAYKAFGPELVSVVPYEEFSNPAAMLRGLFGFLGEPDFPSAAETFGEHINTSLLSDKERNEAYAEIDRTPHLADALTKLHEHFRAVTLTKWEYDRAAHDELRDAQNDIVSRMVELLEDDTET